jgi:hypothetical protein
MQTRAVWVAILVAAGIALPLATARAGDKYQCTLVQEISTVNTTDFVLTKPGNKIKISPAPAPTVLVTQLTLKNVSCPAEGNDKGKAGKCGEARVSGTCAAPPCPVDAVLDMSVHVLGLDFFHVAGIPIEFTKGKAIFQANKTNKIDGSVFGGLVGAILGQPIGFQVLTIRTEGSDPTNPTTGCGVVPLPPGDTCVNGTPLFFTGITAGS